MNSSITATTSVDRSIEANFGWPADREDIENHESLMGRIGRTLRRRPRLLFIANSFRPARFPGCPRTWSIATSLQQLGWEVTVVTPPGDQWLRRENGESFEQEARASGIRILTVRNSLPFLDPYMHTPRWLPELPLKALRRMARMVSIDRQAGWIAAAKNAVLKQANKPDMLLVSAPPHATVPLAASLAERLECPLAIDYRDLWTMNPMGSKSPSRREVRLERAANTQAAVMTTVSPSLARMLADAYGRPDRIHVLPNGFERRLLATIQPHDFGHFAIVYAGSFYVPNRTVHPLMHALARLHESESLQDDWRFHYYGSQQSHVVDAAREAGLPLERIVFHGEVSRQESLAAVAGARVVVVITTSSDVASIGERGVITGKIFEAIGLAGPLLVIAAPGSDVEGLMEAGRFGRVSRPSDTAGTARAIQELAPRDQGVTARSEVFEWTNLGTRLSAILLSSLQHDAGHP